MNKTKPVILKHSSFRIQWSKSNPYPVPDIHKDISPAYIEVGSGSFQDAPSLSLFGSSFDSLKSDFEIELMEKLADAANDIPWKSKSSLIEFINQFSIVVFLLFLLSWYW